MKIKKKFRYDFTGLPCKHCNVILSDKNHSNRSKLTKKWTTYIVINCPIKAIHLKITNVFLSN